MLEELATSAYAAEHGSRTRSRRWSARSRSTAGSATTRPSAAARASRLALLLVRGRRRGGAPEGARRGRDPRAARRVGRARPRLQRPLAARDARRGHRQRARAGASARSSSRSGSATRAPASTRSSTSPARRSCSTTSAEAELLDAIATADAREERHEAARAFSNLSYSMMIWVRPEPALPLRRAGARVRRGARGAHDDGRTSRRSSPGCGCAPATGTRPSGSRTRVIAQRAERPPAAREDRPHRPRDPPRRRRRGRAARRPRAAGRPDGRAAAARPGRSSSRRAWALTTGSPMPTERIRQLLDRVRPGGRLAIRVAAWARVAGLDVDARPVAGGDAVRRDAPGRLARCGRRVRRGRLDVRPRAAAVAARRRGVARRGDRDRPRARRRAADAARRRAHARARARASRTGRGSRRARTRPG